MMREYIFAWTDPSPGYGPEYINISVENGEIKITVRSPATPDGHCGDTAVMTLPREQAMEMLPALRRALLLTQ